MDLPLFLSFAKEFSILPTLIEQDEIGDVFAASCRDGGGHLGFRDLIECLTRLALTIYRDNRRVQTAEQKLTYLLRAMQLDQKDIVMHRLRKAVVQTNTTRPPTNDAVSFDFEQKVCGSVPWPGTSITAFLSRTSMTRSRRSWKRSRRKGTWRPRQRNDRVQNRCKRRRYRPRSNRRSMPFVCTPTRLPGAAACLLGRALQAPSRLL